MISSVLRINMLVTLGLILCSQVFYLPSLVSLLLVLMAGFMGYRLKQQKPFHKIWTYTLTLAALLAIYAQHKTFMGVDAGVATLTVFLFAKSLESQTKRDLIIVFNFALFVAASSFLYSQSFLMAVVVLIGLVSCFWGLYQIQLADFTEHPRFNFEQSKQDLKHVGGFIAYALPFFLLLFIFFPRLPPLWHIPISENKAKTGLSDSMSPGDIAELSQSSELAFRIIGDIQKLPARQHLYWRALILDEYDGQRWTSSFVNQQALKLNKESQYQYEQGWDYQYLPADPATVWITGLDKSISLDRMYMSRQDWGVSPQRQIQRNEPIRLRWLGTQVENDFAHPEFLQRINTRFITNADPQAQALAQTLFQQSGGDSARYVQNVLKWYKQQPFKYSLSPGRLGTNRIDGFLFQSKIGFCEHYASSFAMMMRYVDIPARVVTGYQGGQIAPDGKTWEVRQLDAHAWTEVMINGQWQRIDPTAAIAPQRIDQGMQDFIQQDRSVWGVSRPWKNHNFVWMTKLRIWSDYASYQWQSKVIGYNVEKQQSWLAKLGIHSIYVSILVLIFAVSLLIIGYFGFIYWQQKNRQTEFEKILNAFQKDLKLELKRQETESFRKWMQRLSQYVSQNEQDIFADVIMLYESKMYNNQQLSKLELQHFDKLLKYCSNVLRSG